MREQREIKLRAWDVEWKNMGYVLGIVWANEKIKRIDIVFYDDEEYRVHTPQGKYFLMQYTGLKDKNGKEIYEGDILSIKDSLIFENPVEVFYLPEKAKFSLKNKQHDEALFDITFKDMEIIGNIYENPELVK